MKHFLSLGSLLFVLWLLLSGHYVPLMVGFGVVSVLVTLFIAHRLNAVDHESHPIHASFALFKYAFVLFGKIIKANIDVTLRILGIRPIEPQLIEIPLTQHDDLSRVIYANSITLTPGSASIDMQDDTIVVHTISKDGAEELFEGELGRLVPDTSNADSAKGE